MRTFFSYGALNRWKTPAKKKSNSIFQYQALDTPDKGYRKYTEKAWYKGLTD